MVLTEKGHEKSVIIMIVLVWAIGVGSGGQGAVAPLDFHTWYKYSR